MIFLKRCIGCNAWLEESEKNICPLCASKLHYLTVPAFLPRISKKYFDTAYSALAYEGLIHDAIHQYKYYRKMDLLPWLSELLLNVNLDWNAYDALVPVPLHWWRRLRRGFNPSHLLAHQLSQKIEKPLAHVLKRCKATPPQAKRTSEERLENIKEAFVFKADKRTPIHHARLLLIDDVLTTGATVNECAKVLKKAGVSQVDVLTLARPL